MCLCVVIRLMHKVYSILKKFTYFSISYGLKVKSNPITGLDRPRGFQQVEAPRCQKTIGTCMWYDCQPYAPANFTPENAPGTHFC